MNGVMEFNEFVKKVAGYFDLRTSFYGKETARCTEFFKDYEKNTNIQMHFHGRECMGVAFYADILFLQEDRQFIVSMDTEGKFYIQENMRDGSIDYIKDEAETLKECLAYISKFRHRKKMSEKDIAVNLFKKGAYVEAFAIFAEFKKGFSKEEIRVIQIAHEIMCGHGSIYSKTKNDDDRYIENAKEIIRTKCTVSGTKSNNQIHLETWRN